MDPDQGSRSRQQTRPDGVLSSRWNPTSSWRGIRLWEQPCLRALAWQPSNPVPVAADQAGNGEFALALHASIFVALDHSDWQEQAAAEALKLRKQGNIYFAVGVQRARPVKGRGAGAGVVAIPGFWSDIDVLGPNHASVALPPTIDDASQILRAVPFRPTVVVYTGGGIQPYWSFREPWQFESEKERNEAKGLSRAFLLPRSTGGRWTVPPTCAAFCGSRNVQQETSATRSGAV